jgi:hypothetical protein
MNILATKDFLKIFCGFILLTHNLSPENERAFLRLNIEDK